MSLAEFVAQLQSAGIKINSDRGRLIVEAPQGVLTTEWRAQLASRKAELMTALQEAPQTSHDLAAIKARAEIVGLMAAAYRRYIAIRQVGRDRRGSSGSDRLANLLGSSVHGVVP